jgi:hypothetical protein
MRQYMAHKQSLGVEVDGRYEPVLVATDVENVKVAPMHRNHIDAGEGTLQVCEIPRAPMPCQPKPCSQRRCSVCVRCCEFAQRLLRDDVHCPSRLSQIEMNSNLTANRIATGCLLPGGCGISDASRAIAPGIFGPSLRWLFDSGRCLPARRRYGHRFAVAGSLRKFRLRG